MSCSASSSPAPWLRAFWASCAANLSATHFFSEGAAHEFADFSSRVPGATLHLGGGGSQATQDDLDFMSHCDGARAQTRTVKMIPRITVKRETDAYVCC